MDKVIFVYGINYVTRENGTQLNNATDILYSYDNGIPIKIGTVNDLAKRNQPGTQSRVITATGQDFGPADKTNNNIYVENENEDEGPLLKGGRKGKKSKKSRKGKSRKSRKGKSRKIRK